MRTRRRRLVLLCLSIVATMVVVGWMRASAFQNDDLDVLKVIPENYKLVIDNPFVRVLEATFPRARKRSRTGTCAASASA
jgi:hypothetical protein